MTRGELHRREEAVVSGFVEKNGDKAFAHVQELIKINANEGVLFRFRPPKEYEIDTLEAEQIFLLIIPGLSEPPVRTLRAIYSGNSEPPYWALLHIFPLYCKDTPLV